MGKSPHLDYNSYRCLHFQGNSTPVEIYAEWYWWYGHHRNADKADVFNHHLNTYGPDVVYDDFFSNFTAENWDAKSWVDLIADAGAQYFVLTTKHHDGFAMFDAKNTTNRDSIHYGPKRDILGELFDAAKKYQPQLRRGTYFSLPEWVGIAYSHDESPLIILVQSSLWPLRVLTDNRPCKHILAWYFSEEPIHRRG